MNAVVTKPINPKDLWKALLRWVKVREGMGVPLKASMVSMASTPSLIAPVAMRDSETDAFVNSLRAVGGLDVDRCLARTTHNPRVRQSK